MKKPSRAAVPKHQGNSHPESPFYFVDDVLMMYYGGTWLMGFTEDGIIFNHECYDGYEPEDFAALFMKAVEQDVRFVDYCHKVVNEIEKKRKAREEKRKRKNGS